MRKSILMGLGLAASIATVAVAQQPADSARGRHGDHRGWGDKGQGAPGAAMGRRGPGQQLLKGITLTEAQKTQLKTLRESQRTAMESNRDAAKKDFDAVRAARQKGDTATARALMAKMQTQREQLRTQELAAIRNVLTADQRVQFDKNVAELKQREQERGQRFGQRGKGLGGARRGAGRQG